MEVFCELIQFGCNLVVMVMPLPVEILFGEVWLGEGGGQRAERGLVTWGNPGRVDPWGSRGIHGLGHIAQCRRRHKTRTGGVRRGVGLRRWWVHGGCRVNLRE